MKYRAHIIDDFVGWNQNTIRLAVVDERGRYLMEDATWQRFEEGVAPSGAGVVLPRAAVEEILRAIEVWQGRANHADTEARVLREWLALESARVDRALAGGAK